MKAAIFRDILALLGLALLTAGLWAIHWPTALVVLGVLFLVVAVLSHLKQGKP